MQLYLTALLGASLCATMCSARFAYERGRCDISIFSVVQDMVRNEVRALVNPRLRYSSKKQLFYDLYTPLNPNKRQQLRPNDAIGLQRSFFNPQWPVRFSIHGWTGKSTSCSNAAIKDAYLARGSYNVIIVDWSAHSLDISYARISKQLSAIAATFVQFVHFLHQASGVPYDRMVLIGHSAGAHISGLAGKQLKPQRLGAIIALDPAGLTQLGLGERDRLAPSDAAYVESIHSDITLLGNPSTELSHAAFFVNWGQGQPQCPNATAAEFDFVCDHFAALYYFAASVRHPQMFGATRCKNITTPTTATLASMPTQNVEKLNCGCSNSVAGRGAAGGVATSVCPAEAFMGGEPAVPKSGVYYLSTRNSAPYGYGQAVNVRAPKSPTFLESSFLSQRVIDKIYLGALRIT